MKGRVLIIAGSDPSGGAGVQADIKTVTAFGGYAATAITAITVQNTMGVSAVHPIAPDIIAAQIDAVMGDIGADAIKIGMIGNVEAANATLDAIARYRDIPMVLDPVLSATSGDDLSGAGVLDMIKDKLMPLTMLVTPNTQEAEKLTGVKINKVEDQARAGESLLALGAKAALVKGGHMSGDTVSDVFVSHEGERVFTNPRITTTSTHGTGCTLASAIAVNLAQGMELQSAVKRAIDYVHLAIKTAPGFGAGCGPLNHGAGMK